MLTLYIRNVKTVKGVADYEYLVAVNATVIEKGFLSGHKRKDGWAVLVKKIAEQHASPTKESKVKKRGGKEEGE